MARQPCVPCGQRRRVTAAPTQQTTPPDAQPTGSNSSASLGTSEATTRPEGQSENG